MILLLALLLVSFPAHAEKNSAAETSSLPRRPNTPVLLVLGGFHSCASRPKGNQLRLRFEARVSEYRRFVSEHYEKAPRVLRGCFVNSVKEGNVYFFNGVGRGVNRLKISRFLSPARKQSEELKYLVRNIGEELNEYLRRNRKPALFIVGHSHGAWIAVQVAAYLQASGIPVAGLMTLDPISPLWCTLGDYAEHRGVPKLGCTQPPPEWDANFIFPIFESLGESWFNFYQSQFELLHSGPLPVLDRAKQNFQLRYRFRDQCPNPHSCVDDDVRAWTFFMNQTVGILQDL